MVTPIDQTRAAIRDQALAMQVPAAREPRPAYWPDDWVGPPQLSSAGDGRRGAIGLMVVLVHLTFGWSAIQAGYSPVRRVASVAPLTMISMGSTRRAAISTAITVDPLLVAPTAVELPTPVMGPPEDGSATVPRPNGRTIPPHPADNPVDLGAFVRQAGLPRGQGVTVVLRVEVRASGAVGRVAVDVSGGSAQIDQAAMAYVRALTWVGGRVDEQPATLWVRWGVRLDG